MSDEHEDTDDSVESGEQGDGEAEDAAPAYGEPGYDGATVGVLVYGQAFETGVELTWRHAHAISSWFAQLPEIDGVRLIAIPGGDMSAETGSGQSPDEGIYCGVAVGAVVAMVEADMGMQGEPSGEVAFDDDDIDRARTAWARAKHECVRKVAELAGSEPRWYVDDDGAPRGDGLYLVSAGPLAAAWISPHAEGATLTVDGEQKTTHQTCSEAEGVDRVELSKGAFRLAAQYD